jgi:uncharacterized protein (TIGR00369 family)
VGGWTAPNPDFARDVSTAVLTMPAAKHLGFAFERLDPGEVDIVVPYRRELTQHDGHLQGGVLGSLADFAGGSAAGTLLPPGWVNMTIDFTVKILAPVRGPRIVARGRVVDVAKLLTVTAADIVSGAGTDERVCATALVTVRNIRPAQA